MLKLGSYASDLLARNLDVKILMQVRYRRSSKGGQNAIERVALVAEKAKSS